MTRVGWLSDRPSYIGGAELTQAEFLAAAPEGVEIIDCPPCGVQPDCDVYVLHNCVQYTPTDLANVAGPAVKYHHDVGPWIPEEIREWLDANTRAVCCSPVQAEHMGLPDAVLIPPPVDLEVFEHAAKLREGATRHGAVSVGQWRNHGKAAHRVIEWSQRNGVPVDFYGGGTFAPQGSREVEYRDMPRVLAAYETFVYLPEVIEPFGRTVAEAWASGCEIVTNRLVGALHWIENDPDAITSAASDFWRLVVGAEAVVA